MLGKLSQLATARVRKQVRSADVARELAVVAQAVATGSATEVELGCVDPRTGAYFAQVTADVGLPGTAPYSGIFEVRAGRAEERYTTTDKAGYTVANAGDLDGDGVTELMITPTVANSITWCRLEIARLNHPVAIPVHDAAACSRDRDSLPFVTSVMSERGPVLLRGDDVLALQGDKLVRVADKSSIHITHPKPVLNPQARKLLDLVLSHPPLPPLDYACDDKQRGALLATIHKELLSMGLEGSTLLAYSRGLAGLGPCGRAELEELTGQKL